MKHYPEGHVLYRLLERNYPEVTHGHGIFLYDDKGREYIDASGGAYVTSVGHGNVEVATRIFEQMKKVAYVNGMHFTSRPLEELSDKLTAMAPKGLDKIFLLSSGSEAVEAAIKFVRQVWVERGQDKKYKFISRQPGYHGNTLFTLSISARKSYKKTYGPLLHEGYFVETPYEYRSPVDYVTKGADYYAKQIEDLILKEGADTVAGVILEPISGSSAGGSCPPQEYLKKVQEICRRHNVMTIADEVLVGAGRTRKFFACSHYGYEPDVLILGKSINGGYVPASVVMVKSSMVDEIKNKSGNFQHAQTYMHNPVAASCALAVVDYMKEHKLVENCANLGAEFHQLLRQELLSLPHVGFVAGRGLLAGIEFVQDKATKNPFDRKLKVGERLREAFFQAGLIVWVQTAQLPDDRGDIVLLAPPLVINKVEMQTCVSKVKTVLELFKY